MCVWDESTWVEHSTFILCGAPLCFLKETEGRNDPVAVAQTCTICACPVTLSSSGNIQTSVQFKLAGHGPVTYFPHNMLCNIRDEAVCHQLTNLHHSIVSAKEKRKIQTQQSAKGKKWKAIITFMHQKELFIRPLAQFTLKGENTLMWTGILCTWICSGDQK